jgi:hypothetical protein
MNFRLVLLLLLATFVEAGATITVQFSPSHASQSYSITPLGSGKYNVSIDRGTLAQLVHVFVDGATTDRIRFVNLTTNSNSATWIYVGQSLAKIGSVDSVTKLGSGAALTLIELWTVGDIGEGLAASDDAVKVDTISTIVVGGDVLDGITALSGTLDFVQVDGDLNGDVTAANAALNTLAVAGAVGNSSLVNIRAKTGIHGVVATSINAAVDAKYNGGNGSIWFLGTTGGNFSGSLNVSFIQGDNTVDGISINGDMSAQITVSEHVDDPIDITGHMTGSISIAKALRFGSSNLGEIAIGGNLAGQIIINAGNATSTAWQGDVSANGTTITTDPYYSNTSASLGGGSVGLAPFHLHDEDCIPANGYSGSPPNDNIIRLRWYGPIQWETEPPVTVEYLLGSNWINISDWFDFEEGDNPRELEVIPLDLGMDWGAVTYRIKPTTNLKCTGVTSLPAVHDQDAYIATFTFN